MAETGRAASARSATSGQVPRSAATSGSESLLEVAHLHDKVDHLQSMVGGRLERVEKLLSRRQVAE